MEEFEISIELNIRNGNKHILTGKKLKRILNKLLLLACLGDIVFFSLTYFHVSFV